MLARSAPLKPGVRLAIVSIDASSANFTLLVRTSSISVLRFTSGTSTDSHIKPSPHKRTDQQHSLGDLGTYGGKPLKRVQKFHNFHEVLLHFVYSCNVLEDDSRIGSNLDFPSDFPKVIGLTGMPGPIPPWNSETRRTDLSRSTRGETFSTGFTWF